jgi:pimeloyl-ACP methyl ester carboxylesterase
MPHAVTDDGVKLYYEEAGAGTPILFIHEFADDLRSWEPQVAQFARTHRCIVYNARGYPPSDVPESADQYSQRRAVDDARDVLKHLDIEMAHIVGLSMGGFASLHFGLVYPEMAYSITVAGCGYGSGGDKQTWKDETAAVAKEFLDGGMEEFGGKYVAGPTRVQFENKDPRGYADFVKRFFEHSALGAANTFLGVQGQRPSVYELEEGLKEMTVPCLILTGDEDEPCLEPDLWLKRTIPSAWLGVLPQAGHAINLEEPALFNGLLANFLSSVESGQFRNRDPRSLGRSISGVR